MGLVLHTAPFRLLRCLFWTSLQDAFSAGHEGCALEDPLIKLNHALSNFKGSNKHVELHLQPVRAAGKAKPGCKSKAKAAARSGRQ